MLHIDIEPLRALQIYYMGEKLGVYQGDIRQAEKKRKLLLPPLLKEFLQDYGYFAVNRFYSPTCCFAIDKMEITDDDLVIFGRLMYDKLLAFRRADFAEENPPLYCAERVYNDDEEDDEPAEISQYDEDYVPELNFEPAPNLRLRDFLVTQVVYNLPRQIWQDDEEDLAKMQAAGAPAELLDLLRSEEPQFGWFICWDDVENQLWAVSGSDVVQRRLCHFTPSWNQAEVEALFNRYFFQNNDFEKALPFARLLIDRLQQQKEDSLKLADMYKLAGRCCWATGRWQAAEEFYESGDLIFQKRLTEILDKAKYFYQARGNFYAAMPNEAKSRQAYAQVDKICEFLGSGGARAKGIRLVEQAIEIAGKDTDLSDDLGTLQCALELYEQALAEYQQAPKECKYDIARCQQLKGDLRKKIKELKRRQNN